MFCSKNIILLFWSTYLCAADYRGIKRFTPHNMRTIIRTRIELEKQKKIDEAIILEGFGRKLAFYLSGQLEMAEIKARQQHIDNQRRKVDRLFEEKKEVMQLSMILLQQIEEESFAVRDLYQKITGMWVDV